MSIEEKVMELSKLDNLGSSFVTLGRLLQQKTDDCLEQSEYAAKELYRSLYQQVCQFCSKAKWCWDDERTYTVEEVVFVCNILEEQGLRKESAFSIKFQGRCTKNRQLELVLFNHIVQHQEQVLLQKEIEMQKVNVAQQLILLGEQLQLMRNNNIKKIEAPERLVIGYATSRKEAVSGDSWDVIDLQDGRLVQILCDGMGSGTSAMEQSNIAVQLIKTLLSGGLSVRLALNIMNTILSVQYNSVRFSTVDIAIWNLNTKKIELYKYGASPSFVRNGKTASVYVSNSLPVGILPRVEGTVMEHILQKGDMLIMMSDGLYELNSAQFQWEEIIRRMPTINPQLMAEYLLAIATSRSRGNQKLAEEQDETAIQSDDMTILVSKLV